MIQLRSKRETLRLIQTLNAATTSLFFLVILKPWKEPTLLLLFPPAILFSFLAAKKLYTLFHTKTKNRSDISLDEAPTTSETLKLTNEIFDSIPSILLVVSDKNRVIRWNASAEIFAGMSFKNAISDNLFELIPGLASYREAVDSVIESGKQLTLPREAYGDERKRFLSISIHPLHHGEKKIAILMIDDVTHFEQMDEQLRQAQKMETIGNLAGGLAHDFNNVLGGITGTVALMEMMDDEERNGQQMVEHLKTIKLSAKRASEIVNQLLSLSRKNRLSMEDVNLNDAISHVTRICRNTMDKCVDIEVVEKREPAFVKGDPNQIEQALLNILVNGYHSMTIMRKNSPQGGRLSISIDRINLRSEKSPGMWRISISDTGIGMDEGTVEKIFDPFFTTKGKENGTGLGLSMTYNIVSRHGGRIEVSSVPEVGTVFEILLPISENPSEIKQEKKEIVKGSGLILVVDDEKVIRQTASRMLKNLGYKTITARDGLEAVEIYERDHEDIDAIILDMAMPRMSGDEAYRLFRKIEPSVKVILSSGYRMDRRVVETLESGANCFMQKPYDLQTLSHKVSSVLKPRDL